ncbi:MAG: hypothetical protein M1828_002517 [Chrysothrix sp. TS-e1954]|nr:MAG: hypothetical protein M1828_002517 [Chrysothrix sp. TS-e1954]
MPSKFSPLRRQSQVDPESFNAQCMYLERLVADTIPTVEMSPTEWQEKDDFRLKLERLCQDAANEEIGPQAPVVRLISFGSLSSGFAMPNSDMDLALVIGNLSPSLPRILEKAILNANIGARLLTRTRVPILKVCREPHHELFSALIAERQKWDNMTSEERERYDHPPPQEKEKPEAHNSPDQSQKTRSPASPTSQMALGGQQSTEKDVSPPHAPEHAPQRSHVHANGDSQSKASSTTLRQRPQRPDRPWYREKRLGPLDFPKHGVGIQCDINFANPLGLHNTLLLRCYSHCDIRVRLMVLFVKAWASRRKINSSYAGTLSSYGYVLMVLHFLVNVCRPPICPNLQHVNRIDPARATTNDSNFSCEGYDVQFWRNEDDILALAASGRITQNREPLGMLLRQFFHYYAQQGPHVLGGGFIWTKDTLSLRTPGGLLTKEQKGWTGAKTTTSDNREVRHRFLFAVEDPFELDHNVARTVTHPGIVAIRDEFRRAWRIINANGVGKTHEDGGLLDTIISVQPPAEDNGEKDDKAVQPFAAEDEEKGDKPVPALAENGNDEDDDNEKR